MKISVIITNWNGLSLLKKYLKSVIIQSVEASEVILADDASTDDSLEYARTIQKKYPKLQIISHKTNLGFARNSNHAVKSSIGDYVVLLNSDILPHKDYIKNSLHHFKDPNIFGVGFAEKGHENWSKIYWKDGYIQHEPGLLIKKPHISGWISGGSSVINKKIFMRLGGFDPVYEPFYSEDLDLGYRAWKSGYKMVWEPSSIVEHLHESTMSKFPKRLLDYVKERNRLLNVWRNISDSEMIKSNKITQIFRVLTGPNYLKIILAAHRQIKKYPPPVVFPKLTDKEIFSQFSKK